MWRFQTLANVNGLDRNVDKIVSADAVSGFGRCRCNLDASRYVRGLQDDTTAAMISNVEVQMLLLRQGDRLIPASVSDGRWGGSYVASPHSAYILYAREELDLIDLGWLRLPAMGLIGVADALFRLIGINRVVSIDNWLLSTNLHGRWMGEGVADIRAQLADRFTGHFFCVRSVDRWSNPALVEALVLDGWLLLPSRQIWVTDDMARDWFARNNVQNDRRMLGRSNLQIEDLSVMSDSDADRIAALYKMLYIEKYSALNPLYTARWMQHAMACSLLHFRVARAGDGQIMAVAGFVVRDGVTTNPMLGYDTAQPQSAGLYRIACYIFGDYARSHGLRVNGSAGAAHFKQQRGARSEIEYTAFYVGHLPWWRQWPMRVIAAVMTAVVIPVMKKRML